jgi:recombination protein RecT
VNNAFIDGLIAQLKEKVKYGLTLPTNYNAANALMGAYLILKETTDKNGECVLKTCSQASIANALMDMATVGLSANKNQGYFIAYGGKVHFQKSYFGNITLAKNNGLKKINAEIIYEGDTFKYHIEDGMKYIDEHIQDFMNIDTDKIKGTYAVAIMNDGSKIAEVMNINQLKKAWDQRPGGLKETADSTHTKFRDQMAKKTVINRLCKMIANTSTDGNISEVSDRLDEMETVDIVSEDVSYEIENNSNKVEFEDVVEEQPIPEDTDPVLPDFMKEE